MTKKSDPTEAIKELVAEFREQLERFETPGPRRVIEDAEDRFIRAWEKLLRIGCQVDGNARPPAVRHGGIDY